MCPHFYTHHYRCLITFLMDITLFETFTGYFLSSLLLLSQPPKVLVLEIREFVQFFSGLFFVKLINLATEQLTDHRNVYCGFLWTIESDFLLDVVE